MIFWGVFDPGVPLFFGGHKKSQRKPSSGPATGVCRLSQDLLG